MNKIDRKNLLYGIMIASFIPMIVSPIIFIFSGYFLFPDDILWVIGTWLGLFAFMFIFWQYVLGIKAIASKFTDDIVVTNKLHQTLGTYGFFLVISHPTIIFISYLTQRNINLINLNFSTPTEIAIKFGVAALTIIIFNWILSYILRKKMPFRLWKRLHLLNYFIFVLIYFHAPVLGTLLSSPGILFYFNLIMAIFAVIFLYRLGKQFGFFKHKYKVTKLERITHDVVQVSFAPVNPKKYIAPLPGQFIEVELKPTGETHPFTASEYNLETNEISVSPKDVGPFSKSVHSLNPGELVYLDGPFGVFTRQAYEQSNRKIVFVVGGIGITPFLRFLDFFEKNPNNFDEVGFFYGNKLPEDIAYKDKIDNLKQFANFKSVNALSAYQGDDPQFEKGYVNADLMKKYLKEDLSSYKFFICGPPAMMDKISSDLILKCVPRKQIFMEKFSW